MPCESTSAFQFLPDRGCRIADFLDQLAKLLLADPKPVRPALGLIRHARFILLRSGVSRFVRKLMCGPREDDSFNLGLERVRHVGPNGQCLARAGVPRGAALERAPSERVERALALCS
jgi:hypothetical protein